VKATSKKTLAGQRPQLREVARQLGLSARTLQRRLGEEQVTFQQLTAEARRELARHYLQHSALELGEIAYLLGFEDGNSFFRAFQQWESTTPGEWRATQRPPPRARGERIGRCESAEFPAREQSSAQAS
jgi:AraC-like DNA-binding protein